MKHSPGKLMLEWMISKGLGTRSTALQPWPIFLGSMPTDPDNVLTVYDTLGRKDGRMMPEGEVLIHHGIQIRIRNNDYNVGFKKGSDIAEAFDTIKNEALNLEGKKYILHSFTRPSGVIPLGQELGKTRLLFTLNGTVTISDVTP